MSDLFSSLGKIHTHIYIYELENKFDVCREKEREIGFIIVRVHAVDDTFPNF